VLVRESERVHDGVGVEVRARLRWQSARGKGGEGVLCIMEDLGGGFTSHGHTFHFCFMFFLLRACSAYLKYYLKCNLIVEYSGVALDTDII